MKSKAWTEKFMQGVFFVAACASVLAVALICIFLFANGIPAIKEIGFVKFITGEMWRPSNELFGICLLYTSYLSFEKPDLYSRFRCQEIRSKYCVL